MVPYFAAPKPPAAAPWPFGILPLKPSKSWTKNRLRHFRPWFLLISRESHGELPEKNEHQEDFWSLWHRNAMWSPKNTPIRRTIPPWTGRSVEPPVLRSFLAHLSIPKVFGGPWYFQALVPCFVLKLTMAIRLQSNALFLTPRWQYVHYVLQEIPVENASRIDHDRSSFTVYIYILIISSCLLVHVKSTFVDEIPAFSTVHWRRVQHLQQPLGFHFNALGGTWVVHMTVLASGKRYHQIHDIIWYLLYVCVYTMCILCVYYILYTVLIWYIYIYCYNLLYNY